VVSPEELVYPMVPGGKALHEMILPKKADKAEPA
jgi:hypothetical protein